MFSLTPTRPGVPPNLGRGLALLALALVVAGCSDRGHNISPGADAGDSGPDAPMTAGVGEPCGTLEDCASDALCVGTRGGGDVCMLKCDVAYELCDDGSVCLPADTDDEAAICYTGGDVGLAESCGETNLDCESGLLCFGASEEFYCRTACDAGSGCDDGEYCHTISTGAGLCRAEVGAECGSTSDCADGLTCSLEDGQLSPFFPGGACTADCTSDGDCPGASVCRGLPGVARQVCLGTCEHLSDCRFNGSYDCLSSADCATSSDPDACQAMFGEDSLCVAGVF